MWYSVDTGAQPLILDEVGALCTVLCYVNLLEVFVPLFFSHPPSLLTLVFLYKNVTQL